MVYGRRTEWDEDEAYIERRVRYWARVVMGSEGCGEADLEDIAQHLRLEVLLRRARYDPARASRRTFLARLIEHGARSLREGAVAQKRGLQHPHVSLDAPSDAADGDSPAHGDLISQQDYFDATRGPTADEEELRDLALDLQRTELHLTPGELAVWHQLGYLSKSDAARTLGVPRSTLQDSVRSIARKLARRGLREYCNSSRHFRRRSST